MLRADFAPESDVDIPYGGRRLLDLVAGCERGSVLGVAPAPPSMAVRAPGQPPPLPAGPTDDADAPCAPAVEATARAAWLAALACPISAAGWLIPSVVTAKHPPPNA